MSVPLVAVHHLTVRYGATTALAEVDFDVFPGEVHAIVGENGAGKSTLLRVLGGMRLADAGRVDIAPHMRVASVPQEPEVAPDLSVAETVFLGAELCGRGGWLRRRAMESEAGRLLERVGCAAGPRERVGNLAAAARKQVQLAHALRHDPDVLLLDEPTAVLGDSETRKLFAILEKRKADGRATVYVSHRLEEVLQIADRVSVLRDGQRVSTEPVAAVSQTDLVTRMVGRAVAPSAHVHSPLATDAVRVVGLSAGSAHDVSFVVRHGEVVGLAGLVGAGRSEVLEAIAGIRPILHGRIDCAAPAALLAEDRGRNGIVATFTVRENLCLPSRRWWLHRADERRETKTWIGNLRIRTRDSETPIVALSGGNQQKVLLARALRQQRGLLLLDEPTAGIDVGAKQEIHAEIMRLARAGVAVLIASNELPELLQLCDRIVAMYAGRVVGDVTVSEATEERVAALITGSEMVSGVGSRVSGADLR